MPPALAEYAKAATEKIAQASSDDDGVEELDTLESRIGQAMHRMLERYQPGKPATASTARLVSAAHHTAIAQEFALEPAHMVQAHAMAQAIVRGQGAWAWDLSQLEWHGNEVAIVYRGRTLRIDRLVRRRPVAPNDGLTGQDEQEGQWWVLDYKSTSQPQLQPALCEQLQGYRTAVALAQPGQTVRAAFLTADGTLIELPAP